MSDAGAQPEPATIPPQKDFPVEWASPDEQKIPWELDLMHFNQVMPALEAAYWVHFFRGADLAMQHFEVPLQGVAKPFNYWLYTGIFPRVPPEQMAEQEKLSDEVLMATVDRLQERWDEEWLPEIKRQIEEWDAFDVAAASTEDLRAHWTEVWEDALRLAEIHFQIVLPAYIALSLFDELHNELFAGDQLDSQKLVQGFDNKTLEVNRAVWDLSRKAGASDEVREIFEKHPPGEVMDALAESSDGQAFLEELDDFLNREGKRTSDWGIRRGSWIEDPTPVLGHLKGYLEQEGDPREELKERAADRDAALAETRARLKHHPPDVRDEFERRLDAASVGVVLSEDHGYWIDFQATYRIRRLIMELGRRLADAGTLATAADIFFLDRDEIEEAVDASSWPDHTGQVEARKKEMEHFASLKPPPFMGTDYGLPPPGMLSNALGKFFGAPAAQGDAEEVVTGNAGSAGKFRGTARVVRSLDEADKLGLGEILVAETTSPSWTPLFATAAGIVTDRGGILSHCAVVAREYGIPAVVGTGVATSMIRDGQTIEVDGDAGQVRLFG